MRKLGFPSDCNVMARNNDFWVSSMTELCAAGLVGSKDSGRQNFEEYDQRN